MFMKLLYYNFLLLLRLCAKFIHNTLEKQGKMVKIARRKLPGLLNVCFYSLSTVTASIKFYLKAVAFMLLETHCKRASLSPTNIYSFA